MFSIILLPAQLFFMPGLFRITALALFTLTSCSSEVYFFSYFTDNGQDGLHLAYSEDGIEWKALNNGESLLQPTAGKDKLMRDPCIIKGVDGKFHMVWTVSWNEKGIGYAFSDDLLHWSEQRYLPVMEHEEKARNCWAPEITYDEATELYYIYWATTIEGRFPETDSTAENNYNHRMYYTTTKDFKTFADTGLLYDGGFNVIDATIKKTGEVYTMFLKDETLLPTPQKNIRTATAPSILGPYSEPSPPITGDYWAEGPTVIKIDEYWVVYFDKYRQHQMGAVESTDLKNWLELSEYVQFPEGTRHGTVFSASSRLIEALGPVRTD